MPFVTKPVVFDTFDTFNGVPKLKFYSQAKEGSCYHDVLLPRGENIIVRILTLQGPRPPAVSMSWFLLTNYYTPNVTAVSSKQNKPKCKVQNIIYFECL